MWPGVGFCWLLTLRGIKFLLVAVCFGIYSLFDTFSLCANIMNSCYYASNTIFSYFKALLQLSATYLAVQYQAWAKYTLYMSPCISFESDCTVLEYSNDFSRSVYIY